MLWRRPSHGMRSRTSCSSGQRVEEARQSLGDLPLRGLDAGARWRPRSRSGTFTTSATPEAVDDAGHVERAPDRAEALAGVGIAHRRRDVARVHRADGGAGDDLEAHRAPEALRSSSRT